MSSQVQHYNEQKSCMKEGYYQPEPEFIDFVFNSKITHNPLLPTETHSSRHHQSSSAYTNKLNRRKLNQHKLPNFEDIFAQNANQLQQMAPENTPLPQHSKGQIHHHRPLTDASHLQSKGSSRHRKGGRASSKKKGLASHFQLSRNVFQKEQYRDSDKLDIIMDSQDRMETKQNPRVEDNPHQFLKSLRIRKEPGQARGNFGRFSKKEFKNNPCARYCPSVESQLSPWQIGDRASQCYR